jgi:hypothetical protein
MDDPRVSQRAATMGRHAYGRGSRRIVFFIRRRSPREPHSRERQIDPLRTFATGGFAESEPRSLQLLGIIRARAHISILQIPPGDELHVLLT